MTREQQYFGSLKDRKTFEKMLTIKIKYTLFFLFYKEYIKPSQNKSYDILYVIIHAVGYIYRTTPH